MAYVVGILLALLVCVLARLARFDRDRAFYPTLVTVIASYYVLFAVMGGSTHALVVESAVMAAFVAVAFVGFRLDLRLIVAALISHGVFDFFHGQVITNPGVPGVVARILSGVRRFRGTRPCVAPEAGVITVCGPQGHGQ